MKHIPNLLTLARLALTPYLFLLMYRHDYRGLLWPFALVGVTDVLDGFLAKRFGWRTELGTLLSFDRSGVRYLLVGAVPPGAIEALARGL